MNTEKLTCKKLLEKGLWILKYNGRHFDNHTNKLVPFLLFLILKLILLSTHKQNNGTKKMKMPQLIKPMLATLVDKPFDIEQVHPSLL